MTNPPWSFPNQDDCKRLCKLYSIKQRDLAYESGVSQSAISKFQSRDRDLAYSKAVKMFRYIEGCLAEKRSRAQQLAKEVGSTGKKLITFKTHNTVAEVAKEVIETDISQFPVIQNNKAIGTIRSSDLIGRNNNEAIGEIMSDPLPRFSAMTPVHLIEGTLKRYPAVLLEDEKLDVIGIITPQDLLDM